jgi:hypothetical protein
MTENKQRRVGEDIIDGLKKISEKEWHKDMKVAEISENSRTRWMAEIIKMMKRTERN